MRSNDMNDDEILRRYLLGALDEKQADEIEQRLLVDGELFLLAEAVEGDLLAAAARGDLSPAERGRVLRRLAASPEGRTRFALARGLATVGREQVPAEVLMFRLLTRPEVRAAAVAASLVLAAAGIWIGQQKIVPGPESGANIIARALPAAPASPAPAPPVHRPAPPAAPVDRIAEHAPAPAPESPAEPRRDLPPLVLQLALTTVRSVGGDLARLEVSPKTETVEIRLPLDPDEPSTSFAAILRNAVTGEEVWRDERIAAREVEARRTIVLSVPASELSAGLYEIEVRGATPEGDDLLGKPTFEIATH